MSAYVAQNVVDFQSHLNQISAVHGQKIARQVNFLFQHYAYTEGKAEQVVAQRLIDLVNQNKFQSIEKQCRELGYTH